MRLHDFKTFSASDVMQHNPVYAASADPTCRDLFRTVNRVNLCFISAAAKLRQQT